MAHHGRRGKGRPGPHRPQQTGRTAHPGGTGPESRPAEPSAGGVVTTVKDKAQELASSVTDTAGDAWDGTRRGAQRAASAVAVTAEDAWQEVSTFLQRYPVASFGVGLGAGFLLTRLLGGRGRPRFPGRGSGYHRWVGEPRQYPSNISP